MVLVLPCDFESSQEPNTSQDRETERRHHVGVGQDKLQDTADHNEAVETIEKRHKITLQTKQNKNTFVIGFCCKQNKTHSYSVEEKT